MTTSRPSSPTRDTSVGDRPLLGEKLKAWRARRGKSQLQLALDAGISARHLCFLETGRSQPSREMVLRLAAELRMPLREQNGLLLAAGFAPTFDHGPLDAPELRAIRSAASAVLAHHEPFPAVALDRTRNIVMANRAALRFRDTFATDLPLEEGNIYRLLLHPRGLAPQIVDFATYARHLLGRLLREADTTGDEALRALHAELETYPGLGPQGGTLATPDDAALTLRLRDGARTLAFVTTLSSFGSPFDVTTAELVIECLFPADEITKTRMCELGNASESS